MSIHKHEKLILFFDDCGRDDTPLVGGKCANLGEMCKIGAPVPPGFAITTRIYETFLDTTGAGERLQTYAGKIGSAPTTIAEFNKIGSELADIVLGSELPKPLATEISDAYQRFSDKLGLPSPSVAVRSSGVAEDSASASFAGQYDSYLNVIGTEAVLDRVRRCWASAFTARCISYRLHNGFGLLPGSISVAVQKMVKSRSAGVGFTANPNTGERNKIVIEGNWGTGESVVQGMSNVDIFSIDKDTFAVMERNINKKTRQVILLDSGTLEQEIAEHQQLAACLDDNEVRCLAEHARRLEDHYGLPLDIEWAVDRELAFPDNIFIVQARPITAIAEQRSATDVVLDLALTRLFPV